MQRTDVLVVGAGQAGLAMSHCLSARGIAHVVLERGRVGESWRSERWDSLRLLTPNWMSRLPGHGYAGPDPDGFMAKGEVIAMLEAVKHRVVTMHASDRFFEGGTVEDLRRLEAHPQTGYASILKHGVIGRGLNDYDRIFSILRSVNFQGWISIEDGEDRTCGVEHLRLSVEFLRAKMKEHGLP